MRILFIGPPLYGLLYPLFSLAQAFRVNGHEVPAALPIRPGTLRASPARWRMPTGATAWPPSRAIWRGSTLRRPA